MGTQGSKAVVPRAFIMMEYAGVDVPEEALMAVQGMSQGTTSGLGLAVTVRESEGKSSASIGITWNNLFGRNPMRALLMQHYPYTEVVICILSINRDKQTHEMCLDAVRETLLHPDLSDVAVFVVLSDVVDYWSVDEKERMSVDEIKQSLKDKSMFLPTQELHMMESNTVNKEVLDKAINLASSRSAEKSTKTTEKVPKTKAKKIKNKFMDFWKSALHY